jgi:hypothetical protein
MSLRPSRSPIDGLMASTVLGDASLPTFVGAAGVSGVSDLDGYGRACGLLLGCLSPVRLPSQKATRVRLPALYVM